MIKIDLFIFRGKNKYLLLLLITCFIINIILLSNGPNENIDAFTFAFGMWYPYANFIYMASALVIQSIIVYFVTSLLINSFSMSTEFLLLRKKKNVFTNYRTISEIVLPMILYFGIFIIFLIVNALLKVNFSWLAVINNFLFLLIILFIYLNIFLFSPIVALIYYYATTIGMFIFNINNIPLLAMLLITILLIFLFNKNLFRRVNKLLEVFK